MLPNSEPLAECRDKSTAEVWGWGLQGTQASSLRASRRKPAAGIRRAKHDAQNIQSHFSSIELWRMWKGMKCVTDYYPQKSPSLSRCHQPVLHLTWVPRNNNLTSHTTTGWHAPHLISCRCEATSTVTHLNDYWPVTLTLIVTKCFEKLIIACISNSIDINVDPHQYTHRKNYSTDYVIETVVQTVFTHLERRNSYVTWHSRISLLASTWCKSWTFLGAVHHRGARCWTSRLTDHRLSDSTTLFPPPSLSAVTIELCAESLLFHTIDLWLKFPSRHIVTFVGNTVVVGSIMKNDQSEYRQDVEHLVDWCMDNSCINVKNTEEMVVEFRKDRRPLTPIHIGGVAVDVVSRYKYLRIHLSEEVSWSQNVFCLMKKGNQFLRMLWHARLRSCVWRASTDVWWRAFSIPASWWGTAAAERTDPQSTVHATQKKLLTTTDTFNSKGHSAQSRTQPTLHTPSSIPVLRQEALAHPEQYHQAEEYVRQAVSLLNSNSDLKLRC